MAQAAIRLGRRQAVPPAWAGSDKRGFWGPWIGRLSAHPVPPFVRIRCTTSDQSSVPCFSLCAQLRSFCQIPIYLKSCLIINSMSKGWLRIGRVSWKKANMARTAGIGIRVPPEVKEAAERAAADDHRSVASLLEKLLVEYLRKEVGRPVSPSGVPLIVDAPHYGPKPPFKADCRNHGCAPGVRLKPSPGPMFRPDQLTSERAG